MTFERKLAGLIKLNDENWMKHSNPLSVWTRFTVLPLILISVWSRLWNSVLGTVIGVVLTVLGKRWFLDRMVWLYEDMKHDNDIYKSWDY